jgi:hypothetical protein
MTANRILRRQHFHAERAAMAPTPDERLLAAFDRLRASLRRYGRRRGTTPQAHARAVQAAAFLLESAAARIDRGDGVR